MKVAIVTESFLPQVNGVVNSVRHVVDNLLRQGHEALVIAPGPGLRDYRGVRVVRVRSVAVPMYKTFPMGLPDRQVEEALAEFRPEVVHLASPIALGWAGLRAARKLEIPTVAVYQTDIPAFLRQYRIPGEAACARWVGRVHKRSTRTLVPSRAAYAQLAALGVPNLHVWGRGVDLDLFGPRHRYPYLHDSWARGGGDADGNRTDRIVVGYVGRLAAEKQVRRLTELADLPGISLVVIGDGPEMPWLRKKLPEARFTGTLTGADLATAFASLDVFVHTGPNETFCQTIQEAQASGVPVVAPARGGPLDLVEHERTGLLYVPSQRSSLRKTVQRLATDESLRADLATNGLARVESRSWADVVDELITQHYPQVIGSDDTPVAALAGPWRKRSLRIHLLGTGCGGVSPHIDPKISLGRRPGGCRPRHSCGIARAVVSGEPAVGDHPMAPPFINRRGRRAEWRPALPRTRRRRERSDTSSLDTSIG